MQFRENQTEFISFIQIVVFIWIRMDINLFARTKRLELHFLLLGYRFGATFDCSWNSRGWSARDGLVASVSEDTGKVLDVIYLTRECSKCKGMEEKRAKGEVSRIEFLSWYIAHEPSCLLNQEGSAQVKAVTCFTKVYAYKSDFYYTQCVLYLSPSSLWRPLGSCNSISVQLKSIKLATFLLLVMAILLHTVKFV